MKFFLRCALLSVVTLFSGTITAQHTKGSLRGVVRDVDKWPAENINIRLQGTQYVVATTIDGQFELTGVPAGNYVLEASFSGLKTQSVPVTIIAGQTAMVPDIILTENSRKLKEVVVVSAATKFAQKKSDYVARMPLKNLENAQVYTTVPKELLTEQVVTDFRSAVQMAPGVNNITIGLGSGGVGLSMRMRGFNGANGVGAIRNGMATNWVSLSDPVNLETIEVIKGPSATLFGASTLVSYGGLVNRVTKKPHETRKGEISYSAGSWALSRITADINTPITDDGNVLLRVNAAYHKEKTWQDYGGNKTAVFTPSLTYKITDRLSLDMELELFHTKRNATFIGLGSPAPGIKSLDDLNMDFRYSYTNNELVSEANTYNVYAKATYRISDAWTSQTLFSYANTENKANYLFLLVGANDSISRRLMRIPSTFQVSQVQQNFVGDFHIGPMRNRLLAGVEYSRLTSNDSRATINPYDKAKLNATPAFINMEKYENLVAGSSLTVVNREYISYGGYVSDVLNITNNLLAMASIRWSGYKSKVEDYTQNAVSPKFGLVYQVVKDKVSLFGNYMNGYSNVAPQTTVPGEAPTAMKPEYANQLEGGVKVELLGGKLNGTISYYDIKVTDKVRSATDASGLPYSIQDGTLYSRGLEADLIANPVNGLHIILGYGYNDSRYTEAAAAIKGKRPYSAPLNVANMWVSYKVMNGAAKGLGAGFGGNYSGDSWLNDANTIKVNGYTRMDATVFYEKPAYRLSVKVNNLADKEYWAADYWAMQQNKRQLVLNLTCRF